MSDRVRYRLADILDAIDQIERLLAAKTVEDLLSDRPLKAAFERFLEILSEAARHIPDELRATEPQIEWRRISDIGNHLRHAYHRVDTEILWTLHTDGKLSELKQATARIAERESKHRS